jgi:hypothetical protein
MAEQKNPIFSLLIGLSSNEWRKKRCYLRQLKRLSYDQS